MTEVVEYDDNEMSYEQFEAALRHVSKRHKDKYMFILKGGNSLKNAIFSLFATVWKEENLPEIWQNSLLIQLYKGKNSKFSLDSMRFIHLKEDIPKLFSQIVTLAAKDNLINNMSKFQIATKPGHRATEHIFVILSIMELYDKNRKALIISMYDLKKYFDSESLFDCCSEIYKSQVRGKIYRLLFQLNKNVRIRVKTPVGVTASADTGPTVSQGSSEGAIVSSVNLDNGIKEYYHDNEDETRDNEEGNRTKRKIGKIHYEDIVMNPMLYQDDCTNLADNIDDAQKSNDLMVELLETKPLTLNQDKSKFLLAGDKKKRQKLKEEIEKKPLTLGKTIMKGTLEEKYLGIWLSGSVSESVVATVSHRLGIASRAIHEIRAVIEDSRADMVGAVELGLTLWNQGVMPMVLYGLDVFYNIPKKTMKQLVDLNNRALKMIMGVGKNGCPLPSLYLELACWAIENQLLYRSMIFCHHVATLDMNSLAREFFEIQISLNNHESVVTKCLSILSEWNITNIQSYTKPQFKRFIKSKIAAKMLRTYLLWLMIIKRLI